MKGLSTSTGIVTLVAFLTLVGILVLVESRHRSPEWKAFQRKGLELVIQKQEDELHLEPVGDRKQAILAELQTLRTRNPEIIEISPFGGKLSAERCLTCHFGIEDLSASHPNSVFGCIICHGGNGFELTVRGAHLGLRGGRNPSRLDLAPISCGSSNLVAQSCHSNREHPFLNRVETVPMSLMATNAGIISILRFQWGMETQPVARFGIKSISDGKTALAAISAERTSEGTFSLVDSHFRKFCAACHLWVPRQRSELGRLSGCSACHAPYADDGRYRGCDPTVNREALGRPTSHSVTTRIPDERCRACHNRSARIGLNYHGQMESEQYGTPFVRGGLNDTALSDGRFLLTLVPDIHHEKKIACIDCHTAQDTMGDGSIHGWMKDQIEIRCQDCHGGYLSPPGTMKADSNDPFLQALVRSAPFLKQRDEKVIGQTSKGRPILHVRQTEKGLVLVSKMTGREHPIRVITDKRNGHTIKGHERLECDSCHSAWSPQCYGCHQLLDLGAQGLDHVSEKMTPGRWAEGRTYFRFERNILGITSRGMVGILVPGCQVWNTVLDDKGNAVPPYDSKVMKLRNGLSSIAMGSTHPHTTRKEVPRCVHCHLDPKALGLGEGMLTWNSSTSLPQINPIYDSSESGLKIPYPLEAVVDTTGRILQGTSHKHSRGFNEEELRRILGIAPCLTCHDRYDDPVWEKPGPYRETEACRRAMGIIGR